MQPIVPPGLPPPVLAAPTPSAAVPSGGMLQRALSRRLPPATSHEEQVAGSWLEEAEQVASRIAAEEGDPPGARKVHEAEAVRLWGITDPGVQFEALKEALLTTGVSPEFLDPESPRALALIRARPELAAVLAQPVGDPELAEMLATFAEHPFRFGLFADHSDDPKEQTEYAERLTRLWQAAQTAPAPPPLPGG